jgi:hypothetical protein
LSKAVPFFVDALWLEDFTSDVLCRGGRLEREMFGQPPRQWPLRNYRANPPYIAFYVRDGGSFLLFKITWQPRRQGEELNLVCFLKEERDLANLQNSGAEAPLLAQKERSITMLFAATSWPKSDDAVAVCSLRASYQAVAMKNTHKETVR